MRRRPLIFIGIALILLISIIPARIAIASYIAPSPQAIFILGGGLDREEFAAQIALYYPELDIWISSGVEKNESQRSFQSVGIEQQRVHRDYTATDTVTNFTTLVDDFQQRGIHHLLLITSNSHMPRASAIATIVLGSQGITFTPLSVPSNQPQESTTRIVRDTLRSLLWVVTGRTAQNLNPNLPSYAFRSI
jgi:uncharacterized SAM-binding protein YcdF (DUF218 family)